jgi:hypothetical protein
MSASPERTAELHTYVATIMDMAKMYKDRFVVPEPELQNVQKHLRNDYIEDTGLFVHLVVAAARVRKSGLEALSQQLVELARIGLDHKLRELGDAEQAKRQKAAAKAQDNPSAQQAQASLKRGTMMGASIRKKTPK